MDWVTIGAIVAFVCLLLFVLYQLGVIGPLTALSLVGMVAATLVFFFKVSQSEPDERTDRLSDPRDKTVCEVEPSNEIPSPEEIRNEIQVDPNSDDIFDRARAVGD